MPQIPPYGLGGLGTRVGTLPAVSVHVAAPAPEVSQYQPNLDTGETGLSVVAAADFHACQLPDPAEGVAKPTLW